MLEKLAGKATTPEDQATWLRQLADTVSAAVQGRAYPDGIQRLDALCQRLETEKAAPDIVAYVKFRFLSADYWRSLDEPNADFAKIQEKWLADLEQFVTDFGNTKDAADAMLQLAIAEEFAGQDDKAVKWYSRIASEFPDTARRDKGRRRETPHGVGRSAIDARGQGYPGKHGEHLVVSRQSPADPLLGHVVPDPASRTSPC